MNRSLQATLLAFTLVPSALFTSTVALAKSELPALVPDKVQSMTLQEITARLSSGHYNKIVLNDRLSAEILDTYLNNLDPARSYFYQSDIDEFQKYRSQLDDDIINGDLEPAYLIYNRFQQRSSENLDAAIKRLQSDEPFKFDVDETLDIDREDDPWIQSKADMEDLWRKRIKSNLLNLMLADKTEAEARETLIKRYTNQLKRLGQTNSEDVFQRFANVYTEHFDPHTSYFSPRGSENFKINMSLSLEGIGAVLQSENDMTKVVRLVPAGPADKNGQLKPADTIVGVGQGKAGEIEDVVGWRLDDVVDLIRGPKGSTVRLEVIPSDSKDNSLRKTIAIERNTVKLEEQAAQKRVIDVTQNGVSHKVGVIEIPTFYIDFAALQSGDPNYKSTTRDVEKLINELKQDNVEALIVDLRNNGGGSLREANELVGLFIDRGPTVQIRDPNGRVDIMGDFNPKVAYDGPMAVMVNRLSASASEIFAGAIQDYDRGLIVGGQTFGKGTVQTLQPMNHGQLKLTHAKFYRISGESTQNKGVMPDIAFPSLYDTSEIGESALDGALPWDSVKQARHGYYAELEPLKGELAKRHQIRTDMQPDFVFMREQVSYLMSNKDDDLLPLNIEALKAKRDSAEKWQIDTENRRRAAKGLKPIETLADLDDEQQKDSSGRAITPESEAMVEETARILMDVIDLESSFKTASK
jgi:carboxyl-terminal processing protease